MSSGGVETMTARDGAAEDTDGDWQASHGTPDDPTDAIARADMVTSLEQGLGAVHLSEFVGFSKRGAEGERCQVAEVGWAESASRVGSTLTEPLSPG